MPSKCRDNPALYSGRRLRGVLRLADGADSESAGAMGEVDAGCGRRATCALCCEES